MLAFAVLRGPVEQLRHMFSMQRLPFTSTYLGSMALTLYAALVLQSHILVRAPRAARPTPAPPARDGRRASSQVILFSVVQACALAWYMLSYIPGGAPILKLITRTVASALRALCCRRRSGLLPL